jgi:hypothetical protein
MTSNTSSNSPRDILLDENRSWVRVPYHTLTFGDDFRGVRDSILFRIAGNVSDNEKDDKTSGKVQDNFGKNVDAGTVSKFFGLEQDALSPGMLGRPFHQDTRVGANDAINCLWQFNRDDDIMHPVTTINESMCIGEGRVYATTTQTNQQIAWFTFGVPYYSSMFATFKSAFNDKLARLNVNGYDEEGDGYSLAELFGRYGTLTLCIWAIPLKILYEVSNQKANVFKINRFYELRTRMQLYYKFVDSMLAHWLVDVGMYNNGRPKTGEAPSIFDRDWTVGPNNEKYVPMALMYTGSSIWDILRRRAVNAGFGDSNNTSLSDPDARSELIKRTLVGTGAVPLRYTASKFIQQEAKSRPSLKMDVADNAAAKKTFDDDFATLLAQAEQKMSAAVQANGDDSSVYDDDNGSWMTVFKSSALGATQFIGFRVDKSTDASESFSNSTQPSAFAEEYNAKVKEAASKAVNYGLKGEANSGGAFGTAIDWGADFVRGTLQALQSVDFFGITDLAQAAMTGTYFDAPEQYSGSDFNKSHSLSFQLRSPYGDKVSIYQSIIVPLFCILAGALPRSGGPNSYVQPFLCRVYCKGMFSIPMGIIDSVSIKRGDSEFGWTYDSLPTCIDVNISIKDMSPIMYVCMYDSMFDDLTGSDSAFNEYLLTLSGVGLFERISMTHKLVRGVQYMAHKIRNRYLNPVYHAHNISQYAPVQFIASFLPYTTIRNN